MASNVLENIDMQVLGLQLQQARKKRGITQEDAASIIGAVRTTITAIEKGERRLKANELIKLATAYGRKISDFVGKKETVESFEIQFRAAMRQSQQYKEELLKVVSEWQELCSNYLELESIVNSVLPRDYPPVYNVENIQISVAAENIANKERIRLGLGNGPISQLRDILEQEVGLRIFYLKMPAIYSEMYSYNERLGGCMAINLNHPEERRRWSMAHGYLHFLVHRQKIIFDYDNQYQKIPESEKLAEEFAMYFLMPTVSMVSRFSSYKGVFTPADLCTLAHYYGVSVQALTNRLEDLGLLPLGTWDKLQGRGFKVQKVKGQLRLKELPQRTDTVPLRYRHLAIEALDQGLITEGYFARLLCMDILEARDVATSLRKYSSGMDEGASTLNITE